MVAHIHMVYSTCSLVAVSRVREGMRTYLVLSMALGAENLAQVVSPTKGLPLSNSRVIIGQGDFDLEYSSLVYTPLWPRYRPSPDVHVIFHRGKRYVSQILLEDVRHLPADALHRRLHR